MAVLLRKIFGLLARLCIWVHKPFVIGITGSFGKTTARHIITEILKYDHKNVWTPEGNYNGEWGLPLAILQVRSGDRNPLQWIKAFFGSLWTILKPGYPRILILEYGIDHHGEMKIQTDIVEPDIALFTTLSPSHLQGFSSVQNYYDEKSRMLSRRRKNTIAIGNTDDIHQLPFPCQLWYGSKIGDITFSEIQEHANSTVATLQYKQQSYHLKTPILGKHHIGLISGAILVALQMEINFFSILVALSKIDMPFGRGNVLEGIKGSYIIDGTYNGGFEPIIAGVQLANRLAQSEGKTLIAIIGDMRELGNEEMSRHRELWSELRKLNTVYYLFVGKICQAIISPMCSSEEIGRTFFFIDSREAGKRAYEIIAHSEKKCVVFAKGSQNTLYLEEALKEIILPKEKEKIVRQDALYGKKKQDFWRTLSDT